MKRAIEAPRVTSVYRTDEALHHARCGRELSFLGLRGGQEADFYCTTCLAHVTLPLTMLEDVPRLAAA